MDQTWHWTPKGIATWRFDASVTHAELGAKRREIVSSTVETLVRALPPFGRPYWADADTEQTEEAWSARFEDLGALLDFIRREDIRSVRINIELLCDEPHGPLTIPNGGELWISVSTDSADNPVSLAFTLNADIYSLRGGENAGLAALNAPKLEAFLSRLQSSFRLWEVESHSHPNASAKGLDP